MKNDVPLRAGVPAGGDPCHQRLTTIAQQDLFLGQADQRPVVESELDQLAKRLTEHEQQIEKKFRRIQDDIGKNLKELLQTLQATRAQLEKDLAPLASPSLPPAEALRELDEKLDKLVHRLSRRVRTRLLCALEPAAPDKQIMPAIMKVLDDFRLKAVESLPEKLLLVQAKRPDFAQEPGQSIFEQAVVPELPNLCRSRLLSRFRLYRLRRRLKSDYRLLPLPFQEMVTDALILRSGLVATALIERHEKTHEELQNRLTDHWRAIRYNLDNTVVDIEDILEETGTSSKDASDESNEKRREIGPLVLSAFDQALQTLEEDAIALSSVQEGILGEIRQDHENTLHTIRQGVDMANSLRARLHWGYKSRRKALARTLRQWGEWLAQGWHVATGILHRLYQRLLHVYDLLRGFFGMPQDIEETQLLLADLPNTSEVTEHARNLPPIYRRLYSYDPLVNSEFLVAREEEIVELRSALDRWKSERPATVAIVGPEGSGKTSLLNCLENDINSDIVVSHLGILEKPRTVKAMCHLIARALELSELPDDVDKLILQLQSLSRRVIIVERAHHLIMRAVGARVVMEAFIRLMMATNERFLWLVSMRLYPWQRMEYLFNARRYFTYVIPCTFHDKNELKEALLRRERVTGHDLIYVESEKPGTQVRKLLLTQKRESAPVQQALADEYFSSLYEISGGNMRAALYFWLQSLSLDSEKRILVQPCPHINYGFIRHLERQYHFTLAEVVGHGTLSIAEHSEIFRLDDAQSRLQLDYLRKIRLLEIANDREENKEVRYEINPVFHKPITRTLLNLNVLY